MDPKILERDGGRGVELSVHAVLPCILALPLSDGLQLSADLLLQTTW